MEEKDLKVNIDKTKAFCMGENVVSNAAMKYPCLVSRRGIGRNSIQCVKCSKWVHKKCSKISGNSIIVKDFE